MGIYEDGQVIARELMAEFKQGVVNYVKITPGNGPVDNPGPSVRTLYGINSTANGVSTSYIMKGLAIASDLQVIAPVDIRYTPDQRDMVNVDGLDYKINKIIKKPEAGTVVVYIFIIGRG